MKEYIFTLGIDEFNASNNYIDDMKKVIEIFATNFEMNSEYLDMLNELIGQS